MRVTLSPRAAPRWCWHFMHRTTSSPLATSFSVSLLPCSTSSHAFGVWSRLRLCWLPQSVQNGCMVRARRLSTVHQFG